MTKRRGWGEREEVGEDGRVGARRVERLKEGNMEGKKGRGEEALSSWP